MRAAFGSFRRGNARLATLGNAIEGRNVTAQFTVFTVSTKGTNPPFGWQARATTRSQRGHISRYALHARNEAPDHTAAQPRGRLRRSPFQRRQYYNSKAPQGAIRALAGATSSSRGCIARATENHTRAYTEKKTDEGGSGRKPAGFREVVKGVTRWSAPPCENHVLYISCVAHEQMSRVQAG